MTTEKRVTSVSVEAVGAHDRVWVWVNGQNVGSLTVGKGDGEWLKGALLAGQPAAARCACQYEAGDSACPVHRGCAGCGSTLDACAEGPPQTKCCPDCDHGAPTGKLEREMAKLGLHHHLGESNEDVKRRSDEAFQGARDVLRELNPRVVTEAEQAVLDAWGAVDRDVLRHWAARASLDTCLAAKAELARRGLK